MLGSPYDFPSGKYIDIHKFPFKVQQKPTIAKVKVGIIAVGMHHVIHLCVENLDEGSVGDIVSIICLYYEKCK